MVAAAHAPMLMLLAPFLTAHDPLLSEFDRAFARAWNDSFPGLLPASGATGSAAGSALPGSGVAGATGVAPWGSLLRGVGGGGTLALPFDVVETDAAYELHADTPGMAPEDIRVELQDRLLTVSGGRRVAREERDERGRVWRAERGSYAFARSFSLPPDADGERLAASLEGGVLRLVLPKLPRTEPKAEPRRIAVTAKRSDEGQVGAEGGKGGKSGDSGDEGGAGAAGSSGAAEEERAKAAAAKDEM